VSGVRRIGLAGISLVAVAAFAVLTYVVTRGPGGPEVDRSWHDALRAYAVAHPAWLSTWNAVTQVGASVIVFTVDAVLVIVCLVRRWWTLAAFVAFVGLAGWGLRILLRNAIERPRPVDPLWGADGASFPSGHTTNATLMALLVVIVCWPLARTMAARWALGAGAAVVALAVGFSRVAGGVHWPTDVVGGWLLAVGWLCLVAAVFPGRPRTF
jgi:membrane-associated phospholipid phosphatase